MTIKTFEIDWKGGKSSVEYDDEATFGDIEQVLRHSIDASNPMKPSIDISTYRQEILVKVIKKAPFNHKDLKEIKAMPYKTAKVILEHIMDDYPMSNFLEDWMTSVVGSDLMKKFASESTPSVPVSSDGPKTKSTNSQQSTSKS